MKFVTSDQVALDYTDQGTGPVVLILTGFGGQKVIWNRQLPIFLKRGMRVLNLDLRNQGASQHTSHGLRMSRLGMDIAEFMAAQQVTHFGIMGNSMGAAAANAYLSLFGQQRVDWLIDVDQPAKMVNDATWQYGFKGLTWANFPSRFDQPLGPSTYRHIDDDTFALVQAAEKAHPFDAKLDQPLLVDHAFQDWRDVLHQFTHPYLMIAGQESPYYPSVFAALTAAKMARAQAVVIPAAGHVVMAEQSRHFNQVLQQFLNGLA
ncbi:halo peroxidase [Lactobacillus selangorensis]|uniref:Halo peroxidase n=1 Tax=Lactobacillus selangorensis TaxID=81857 RepID=A0A0R2FZ98_9LACO|nr:alpha/beta hydrolase [Lactobacillus selangorensis]KRN29630.1 halo peroxidase [Lactobacillus selangorensis]KRN33841.1 halo peroxidase [Lactobacillus selangorensis]